MWTNIDLSRLNDIKTVILRKKITLNFLIDIYSFRDKLYRYIHNGVSIITTILVIIQSVIDADAANKIAIALSIIVSAMIKLRDYITYNEVRDLAKAQTIKYTQLYDRIEREIHKDPLTRQPYTDFAYWITRELQHIEVMDPELSYNDKKKLVNQFKSLGITYDDDIHTLMNLMKIQNTTIPDIDKMRSDLDEKMNQADINNRITINSIELNNPIENNKAFENNKAVENSKAAESSKINNVNEIGNITRIERSNSDDYIKRDTFKKNMATLSPRADLNWALERLKQM